MAISNGPALILSLMFTAVFTVILCIISISDIRTKKITDPMVLALLPLVVISAFLYPGITLVSRVLSLFTAALPMFVVTVIRPNAFGGGDIKLMAAVGLILGWKHTLLAFIIASLIAIIYSLIILIIKKATIKDTVAFGPALCIGSLSAFIAGDLIIAKTLMLYSN